jgi:hypothetical protein
LTLEFDARVRLEFVGSKITSDADRLSRDPATRLVVSKRASDRRAAARNTVGRFETGILATNDNQAGVVER